MNQIINVIGTLFVSTCYGYVKGTSPGMGYV
jgi:hypothetical protein